jgi:hypothetical protein
MPIKECVLKYKKNTFKNKSKYQVKTVEKRGILKKKISVGILRF